jgi:DNA/RNA endonuclease YhcR with UshA esterase domain
MKALLSLLAIVLFAATAIAGHPIMPPEQAAERIGKRSSIQGVVTQVHVDEKATFVNMGGIYPNQTFTAVIFPRTGIDPSELEKLNGKSIIVSGVVREHKGKPQIVVDSMNQISLR